MKNKKILITLEEYIELINDRERLFYFNDLDVLPVIDLKANDKYINLTKMSDLLKDERVVDRDD